MKYINSDLRRSNLRSFRAILVGSLLFLLTVIVLFQIKARVNAAPLMAVTGVDSIFTNALSNKVGSKIAPEVMADTLDGKRASVVIYLADQANVDAAYGVGRGELSC